MQKIEFYTDLVAQARRVQRTSKVWSTSPAGLPREATLAIFLETLDKFSILVAQARITETPDVHNAALGVDNTFRRDSELPEPNRDQPVQLRTVGRGTSRKIGAHWSLKAGWQGCARRDETVMTKSLLSGTHRPPCIAAPSRHVWTALQRQLARDAAGQYSVIRTSGQSSAFGGASYQN